MYQNKRRHIPEASDLHSYLHENFISHWSPFYAAFLGGNEALKYPVCMALPYRIRGVLKRIAVHLSTNSRKAHGCLPQVSSRRQATFCVIEEILEVVRYKTG